jgi:hypothetical protein
VIHLPHQESKQAAVVKPTKASKQSKARKMVAKDGEWLSAKPKATKRKKAASSKSKPAKKAKPKISKKIAVTTLLGTKISGAKAPPKRISTEVFELLSDDDAVTADIPLSSLVKQNIKPETDEALWDDDSSEEEFEFFDELKYMPTV